MPKERKVRPMSIERAMASPLMQSSSRKRRSDADVKEWEEARCPVCMEHPHNAVLLWCSSHDKGCRPYMCDTSYRHSNCLDQFRKSSSDTPPSLTVEEQPSPPGLEIEDGGGVEGDDGEEEEEEEREQDPMTMSIPSLPPVQMNIQCPLCRGHIDGWVVIEPARRFMNAKSRCCACETCEFIGNYPDLRKHARLDHPLVRPSRLDPERERNWRRLERQRDIGDFLSTIRSVMGEEREEDELLPVFDSGWMTVLLFIRVFRQEDSSWSGTSRPRTQISIRRRSRRLWGESYPGDMQSSLNVDSVHDDHQHHVDGGDDDDDDESDGRSAWPDDDGGAHRSPGNHAH